MRLKIIAAQGWPLQSCIISSEFSHQLRRGGDQAALDEKPPCWDTECPGGVLGTEGPRPEPTLRPGVRLPPAAEKASSSSGLAPTWAVPHHQG